jgi:hypothetical protein
MKRFAVRLFSALPPFSWLIQKLVRNDIAILALKRDLELLSAEALFPRRAAQLRSILCLLKPRRVVGFDKIRIGANHDGGYVMLDDFGSTSGAFSLGIADEVSWDLAIAGRGIGVQQFDYSISRSPVDHPRFTFSRRKVAGIDDIRPRPEKKQLLKIDIEGSEWGFFDEAPSESLACFTQIVGEFHGFSLYYKPEWQLRAFRALQKLNQTHQLIHIHGNNGGGTFWADGILIPDLFELTFVLRSEYRFEDTDESFPGFLDFPNISAKTEYSLDEMLASSLCDADS